LHAGSELTPSPIWLRRKRKRTLRNLHNLLTSRATIALYDSDNVVAVNVSHNIAHDVTVKLFAINIVHD
jgi:hypothetical protein